MMTAIDDNSPSNVYINDLECILNDIQSSQKIRQNEIDDRFNDWSCGLKIHTDQHHARCMERDTQMHHPTQLDINDWSRGLKLHTEQNDSGNISSNPENTYSTKEQLAILLEIMKCYNTTIREYQKNMRELSIIANNLIKAHNECGLSVDDYSSDETIPTSSSLSLYEYFMQFLWGKKPERTIETKRHNAIDLANVFEEARILKCDSIDILTMGDIDISQIRTGSPSHNKKSAAKSKKKRNTIQPIIKHIPQM